MDAIFLAKYDTSGQAIWGKTANSTKWNSFTSLTIDKYDNIYGCGFYASNNFTFDSDILYNVPTSMNHFNYFLAKIGTAGIGMEIFSNNKQVQIYPNPSSGQLTIESSSRIEGAKIYNSLGALIKEVHPLGKTHHIELSPGIYYAEISTPDGIDVKKIIVQ